MRCWLGSASLRGFTCFFHHRHLRRVARLSGEASPLAAALGMVAALSFTAGPAFADELACETAKAKLDQVTADTIAEFRDSTKSAAVFSSCVAVGSSQYHGPDDTAAATGAAAACAALGCIIADSYANCVNVNASLFTLALEAAALKQQLHDDNCPP